MPTNLATPPISTRHRTPSLVLIFIVARKTAFVVSVVPERRSSIGTSSLTTIVPLPCIAIISKQVVIVRIVIVIIYKDSALAAKFREEVVAAALRLVRGSVGALLLLLV